jgi:hypothetical protein
MALGGGQHVGEQLPVGGLDRGTRGKRPPCVGDAAGESIAKLLELAEVEHPRRPRGTDPVRHVDPPEALGHQPGQLELELADLAPQLDASETLVDYESVEHSPHGQILSGLEGRGGNP